MIFERSALRQGSAPRLALANGRLPASNKAHYELLDRPELAEACRLNRTVHDEDVTDPTPASPVSRRWTARTDPILTQQPCRRFSFARTELNGWVGMAVVAVSMNAGVQ